MSNKLHNQSVDNLFDAILTLRNREECYAFFMDVCTMNEIASLSQRRTYLDISEKTGASTATISRVNRSLNYGSDGYQTVWRHLDEKKESSDPS